jgi:hypothetical protein
MPKFVAPKFAICALLLAACMTGCSQKKEPMTAQISIGNNIEETRIASGLDGFAADDVNGNIRYTAKGFMPGIAVKFGNGGSAIEIKPVFGLSLNTDRKRMDDLRVYRAGVQIDSAGINSHSAARHYLASLLNQFKQGNWERWVPDYCPAVTGRSSALDINGTLSGECPLDPHHVFSEEDFITLFRHQQTYQWLDNNVRATLEVSYSTRNEKVVYDFYVKFEDHAVVSLIASESAERERKQGDAKGWNSSQEYEKQRMARKIMIAQLERNATLRGDRVIVRK